jgi:hypothetical protein
MQAEPKFGREDAAMGMDLSGAGGYFRWTNSGWYDILELGKEFGWIPTGTGPPRGTRKEAWGLGAYYGNDGQRVYARDARALADALERAVAALPQRKSQKRTRIARATDYLEAELTGGRRPRRGRVAVSQFGWEDVAYIREFIEYCRAGSFRLF